MITQFSSEKYIMKRCIEKTDQSHYNLIIKQQEAADLTHLIRNHLLFNLTVILSLINDFLGKQSLAGIEQTHKLTKGLIVVEIRVERVRLSCV